MKKALLVIDAQKIYTDPSSELYCKGASTTIGKINALVDAFTSRRLPIVFVRHLHKVDASDLGRMFDYTGEPEEAFNFKEGTPEVDYDTRLTRPQSATEVIKHRYSAFAGTDLNAKLRAVGATDLAICGFMTNFCCESTAREAHDRDYFVDFVLDATGTPGTDNLDQGAIRKIVGELLSAGFARVLSAKAYLRRLKGRPTS